MNKSPIITAVENLLNKIGFVLKEGGKQEVGESFRNASISMDEGADRTEVIGNFGANLPKLYTIFIPGKGGREASRTLHNILSSLLSYDDWKDILRKVDKNMGKELKHNPQKGRNLEKPSEGVLEFYVDKEREVRLVDEINTVTDDIAKNPDFNMAVQNVVGFIKNVDARLLHDNGIKMAMGIKSDFKKGKRTMEPVLEVSFIPEHLRDVQGIIEDTSIEISPFSGPMEDSKGNNLPGNVYYSIKIPVSGPAYEKVADKLIDIQSKIQMKIQRDLSAGIAALPNPPAGKRREEGIAEPGKGPAGGPAAGREGDISVESSFPSSAELGEMIKIPEKSPEENLGCNPLSWAYYVGRRTFDVAAYILGRGGSGGKSR